ncbi:hypothetical protein Plhal710r2_c016g0072861 [Plasmopara halstedii]
MTTPIPDVNNGDSTQWNNSEADDLAQPPTSDPNKALVNPETNDSSQLATTDSNTEANTQQTNGSIETFTATF